MFLTLFISLGFRFAFGVYYSAILDETGWGRAETAGVVSAAMIVYASTAALSGDLFDRVGAAGRVSLRPRGRAGVVPGGGALRGARADALLDSPVPRRPARRLRHSS